MTIAYTSNTTTGTDSSHRLKVKSFSSQALKLSAQFWFLVTAIGQWIFVYYIIAAYGSHVAAGDIQGWNQVSANVVKPGDLAGNTAFAIHIIFAVMIIGGGPLQLIPKIRSALPTFHRWNGRLYLTTAAIGSLAGLYMIWTREMPAGLSLNLGISLDAILILVFGALAWRAALARKLAIHRRWALRLFMVVSAVWFFRVGLMAWLAIHQGPVGFDPETFTGPFITFWAFAQYLLPLAALEFYLYAKERGGPAVKLIAASTVFTLTCVTGVGIFAATMGMWLPHL